MLRLRAAFAGFVLLGLLAPMPADAKGVEKRALLYDGEERTYYVFAPPKAEKKIPLLLVLHGSNRDGKSLVDEWKSLAKKEGILVVGPDSRDSRLWAPWSDGPEFLRAVMKEVREQYSLDDRRLYLFGHSAGGHFALQVSLQEADLFAASAVHAGALHPDADFLIRKVARPIPMAIWIGDRDQYVSVESVRRTREVMLEGGLETIVHEMKGHNHWYYDLAGKINRQAWDFLSAYQLDSAAHGPPRDPE